MADTSTEKKARAPRIADTATISMLADKEGKLYGKDNNPKRKGSASEARFAKYKDGMTVAKAKEAGLSAADISYDADHGYIKLTAAPEAAPAAPKAA